MQRGYEQAKHTVEIIAPTAEDLELEPYEVVIKTIPTELAQEVHEFIVAVNRAACELEHQGQRSHRIALQLLTAMATFTAKTGLE